MSAAIERNNFVAPARWATIQSACIFVAILGTIGAVIGLITDHDQFFRSYVLGFTYWWNLSLGCLALLMLYHLVGGMWGFTMRRAFEAAALNVFVLAVLWIPLIFGMHVLYPWLDPANVAASPALQHKAKYLNHTWWIGRGILYFAIWGILAFALNRWSSDQDKEPHDYNWRYQRLGGSGLVLYLLTITFAGVDWTMSIDPNWSSTIYGLLILANQALLAVAFIAVIARLLWDYPPMEGLLKHYHFQDWGKLMLTFTMIFGYFQFSQLLVIWSTNMPEEITWYMNRLRGGWEWVSFVVAVCQFCIPFALLLSRARKRNPNGLLFVAVWVLVMQWVVVWWISRPNMDIAKAHINFSWQDLAIWAGIGGWWLAAFFWRMRSRPLLAVYDPKMEVLMTEHDHAH